MPLYIPTITTFVNGVVTVTSTDATPYNTIINSMGSFVYGIKEMYLKANSNNQILQSYQFNRYDVNGALESYVDVPAIDPYQFQTSLFLKLAKDNNIDLTKLNITNDDRQTINLIPFFEYVSYNNIEFYDFEKIDTYNVDVNKKEDIERFILSHIYYITQK
jgi:hypothetical protein